ncbi:conserved Plasmodium protein, unknown function [Plasmodium sp. DRC-Itaito]|nr:conserved Plasmodium protein, unknown function [Plasmodium sp. DRC-Itaito]
MNDNKDRVFSKDEQTRIYKILLLTYCNKIATYQNEIKNISLNNIISSLNEGSENEHMLNDHVKSQHSFIDTLVKSNENHDFLNSVNKLIQEEVKKKNDKKDDAMHNIGNTNEHTTTTTTTNNNNNNNIGTNVGQGINNNITNNNNQRNQRSIFNNYILELMERSHMFLLIKIFFVLFLFEVNIKMYFIVSGMFILYNRGFFDLIINNLNFVSSNDSIEQVLRRMSESRNLNNSISLNENINQFVEANMQNGEQNGISNDITSDQQNNIDDSFITGDDKITDSGEYVDLKKISDEIDNQNILDYINNIDDINKNMNYYNKDICVDNKINDEKDLLEFLNIKSSDQEEDSPLDEILNEPNVQHDITNNIKNLKNIENASNENEKSNDNNNNNNNNNNIDVYNDNNDNNNNIDVYNNNNNDNINSVNDIVKKRFLLFKKKKAEKETESELDSSKKKIPDDDEFNRLNNKTHETVNDPNNSYNKEEEKNEYLEKDTNEYFNNTDESVLHNAKNGINSNLRKRKNNNINDSSTTFNHILNNSISEFINSDDEMAAHLSNTNENNTTNTVPKKEQNGTETKQNDKENNTNNNTRRKPTKLEKYIYQSVVMFFMTLLPWWVPDVAYLEE